MCEHNTKRDLILYLCWHWIQVSALPCNYLSEMISVKESLTLVLAPPKVNSWLRILLTILIEINGVCGVVVPVTMPALVTSSIHNFVYFVCEELVYSIIVVGALSFVLSFFVETFSIYSRWAQTRNSNHLKRIYGLKSENVYFCGCQYLEQEHSFTNCHENWNHFYSSVELWTIINQFCSVIYKAYIYSLTVSAL